jgi:hypothetical protein
MHRVGGEGLLEVRNQSMRNVAGIQHRRFSRFAQAVVTMRQDVGQCTQHHAIIAEKCFDPAD